MDEQGAIFDASHYAILGVEPSASAEEIRRAYKDLAKKYHPDRTPSAIANALMARINHAYEVLSDPARRRAYDDDQAVRTSSRDEGSAKSRTRTRKQQQSPSHYTNDAAYDRLVMQSIEFVRRDYQSLLPNVTLDQLRWLIERIPVDARRCKASIVRVAEKTFLQSDRETPGAECIVNALFDLMLLMLLSLDTSNDGKGNGKGWRTVRIDNGWCAISPTDTVGPVVGTSDEAMARHPARRGYDDVLRKTVALWEREGFDAALDGLRGAQKESSHQPTSSARSEMTFVARTVSAVFSLGLSVLVLFIAVMVRQACQAPPRRNTETPRPSTDTTSYVPSNQMGAARPRSTRGVI